MTGHAGRMGTRRKTGMARLLMAAATLTMAACASTPGHAPTEHPLSNAITWSTASESDNFGFDVYRAKQADGPYERITPQPLLGGGTTDLPRDYRYVDRGIEAETVYFYYVESISLSGKRKRFTPVMKAAPKKRPDS